MEGTAGRGKVDEGFVLLKLPVCKLIKQRQTFRLENTVDNLIDLFIIFLL